LHAALAIGALLVLKFVVHAVLAIGALQVLVIKSLFICTLLLPSGLCRCLLLKICVYLHAALAIGALQVLVIKSLCLFARRSCHQSLAGACD